MRETLVEHLLTHQRYTNLAVKLETNEKLWKDICSFALRYDKVIEENCNEPRIKTLLEFCRNNKYGEGLITNIDDEFDLNLEEFF